MPSQAMQDVIDTLRGQQKAAASQPSPTLEQRRAAFAPAGRLHPLPDDVMVTDVALPDALDGVELVKYARARHPALRSLFISGRRGPIVDEPERDDFVGKPFRSGELLGCVLELLYRGLPKKEVSSPLRAVELATIEAKLAVFKDEHRDREAGDFIATPAGREPRGRS